MKLSISWLKDYVAFKLNKDELVYKLTMLGLEVEKIEPLKNDYCLEVEVTPNRPDCLNMIGIARELSAGLNAKLKTPAVKTYKKPAKKCSITIDDKKGCQRYIGTIIENVQVAPTKGLVAERLQSIGSRLINNVVDVTNFCLMEFGQPLHAFDYDKLIGGKIIVRRAKKGEKIVTIDGIERELDESILVIADAKRPIAIAGIMGGKETEVTDKTKNILLESAYFDPILIRRASRKLGLGSDSSYRFERGVNYETVATCSARATRLILDHAGGTVSAFTDGSLLKQKTITIPFSVTNLNARLGSDLRASSCKNILSRLGCKVIGSTNSLKIIPPLSRIDLREEIDLIEEIARVVGYDKLPMSLPLIKITNVGSSVKRDIKTQIRQTFKAFGLSEAINYTMYNRKLLAMTKESDLKGTEIKNPLSADQEIMRPSLVPSLLTNVLHNFNNNQRDLRLFEIGKKYIKGVEHETLAIVLTGKRSTDWRQLKKEAVDFYDSKGIVEALCQQLRIEDISFSLEQKTFLELEQSASIRHASDLLGCIGKVSSAVLSNWDIKSDQVFYAELDLEKLFRLCKPQSKYQPLFEFPSVQRDISLAVKTDVSFAQVQRIAKELGSGLLTSIQFVEEYLGDKIPAGHRGIVFSLTYQSKERTLREEEVNAVHTRISEKLVHDLHAIKR
jgi:phenylalanyl-tRNA synthetase beta chain